MVRRLDGARKKSRQKMTKSQKTKGKISISNFFREFKEGEKAVLKAEPAYQKGIYPLKFHGKIGIIKNKKGNCYEVSVKDGKEKILVVHPVHLRKA